MNMIDIKRKSRHAKKSTFALKLTPLIDMMTILLVFLLKSYSAEGQIVTVTQDLRLPESTADTRPRVTSVVAVTSEWILLDGRPISRVRRILEMSAKKHTPFVIYFSKSARNSDEVIFNLVGLLRKFFGLNAGSN